MERNVNPATRPKPRLIEHWSLWLTAILLMVMSAMLLMRTAQAERRAETEAAAARARMVAAELEVAEAANPAGASEAAVAASQLERRVLTPAGRTPVRPPQEAAHGLRVLDGVRYENLTLFPVVASATSDTRGFLTLDEGLASGEVVVHERGTVNRLALENRSKRPLLLLAGEVVSGGKQDRVIAKDRIVAPGADPLPLDVFCVEHGRWTGGGKFAESKVIVHPSVRENAAVNKDQSRVWAAVREGSTSQDARDANAQYATRAAGAPPPAAMPRLRTDDLGGVIRAEAQSESYRKVYQESRVGQSVESFAAEIERRFARATRGERVVGVVVAYGGTVAWSDVFASPSLHEKYWSKLLRSYVVEALARPNVRASASIDDAADFLAPLRGSENTESEPGVYRWREIRQGRYAQITIEALPMDQTLHSVKILRTS